MPDFDNVTRIVELQNEETINNDDYIAIDGMSDGTRKVIASKFAQNADVIEMFNEEVVARRDADTAIRNSIPTQLSQLSEDSTHRLVTDTEKTTWNNKQSALTFDTEPTPSSTNPVTSGGIFTREMLIRNQTMLNFADNYSNSSTYEVGDYVNYSGTLFKCRTAITTPESWNSSHWQSVNVTDELGTAGVSLTQSEYDALTEEQKMNGTVYYITDAESNEETELWSRVGRQTLATESQVISGAINELKALIDELRNNS